MITTASYPASAARALGFLKSSSNDIEVYVEDQGCPNVWLAILRKSLPPGTKLDSVTVLGGRLKVLEACKLDQKDDGRRKLFIIDADLDLAKGKPKPQLKNLYRLRAYCLENYLLIDSSISQICAAISGTANEADVVKNIGSSAWIAENKDALVHLFAAYATANLLKEEIPTVSFNIHRLRENSDDNFKISNKKVLTRIISLFRELRTQVNKELLASHYANCKANIEELGVNRCISGKHYIAPAVYARANKNLAVNIGTEKFTRLLSLSYDPSTDPFLVRRLKSIMS